MYIFDTSHYTLQSGETNAGGQLTATGYTGTFLTLSGATIASTNHGINGAATMTLKVPTGKTTLTFVDCIYGSQGTVTVKKSDGSQLVTVAKTKNTDSSNDKSSDGASCEFSSDATQTVTIELPSDGYTHAIKVKTVSN